MLEENPHQKKMLFFMRFVRIVSAALVALALLYLIHQKRMKDNPPAEDTPTQQAAPEAQPVPIGTPEE